MNQTVKKTSGWGWGIFALYTSFAGFMLTIVLFVSCQEFALVEEDYYQKELAFQQQIDRVERTATDSAAVTFAYRPMEKMITLTIPAHLLGEELKGAVQLFRPSDESLDRSFPLTLDGAGEMILSTAQLSDGMYRVRVNYKIAGREYFSQEMIVIE